MKGVALYVVILLMIGGIPVLAVAGIEKWKQGQINPMTAVSVFVSGVVAVALLATITDRINRGIWTFAQVSWCAFSILAVLVLAIVAYIIYKEHLEQRGLRG